jgi:16S rRNA (guanine527-N7)-methyltransferase
VASLPAFSETGPFHVKQTPATIINRDAKANLSPLEVLVAEDIATFGSLVPSGNHERLVSPLFVSSLCAFLSLLAEENAHVNLTANAEPRVVLERHIHDSLAPLLLNVAQPRYLLDIGSGGGFPAVPLALAWPETAVTLVESIGKKARFLQRVVDLVPLPRTTVLAHRIETSEALSRSSFDMITARGVASVEVLYDYALPLLAPGGKLVMWKGENDLAVLEESRFRSRMKETHCTPSVLAYRIPGIERRSKLVILQVAPIGTRK